MHAWRQALLDPSLPPPPGLVAWNGSEVATRFAVYRNNVVVSLIDALADTYPVVVQLVGEAFFRAMAREYVRAHLPTSPVLAQYGGDFATFIDTFAPAASVPYLSDVARLEWAYLQALHAPDAPVLTPAALQAALADPERLPALRLHLHPSLHGLRLRHAAVSIWAAHHGEGALEAIDPGRAENAVVVRTDLSVQVIPVADGAVAVLDDLAAGLPLGAVFERLAARDAPLDLGEWLGLLLRVQGLSALSLTPTDDA
ncbi:MAG TPA: DNA-binding domain-containing protein [Nevskiales bacterium]|nr:DNA-binding domain-containing protein [Nevskiales bacterium]